MCTLWSHAAIGYWIKEARFVQKSKIKRIRGPLSQLTRMLSDRADFCLDSASATSHYRKCLKWENLNFIPSPFHSRIRFIFSLSMILGPLDTLLEPPSDRNLPGFVKIYVFTISSIEQPVISSGLISVRILYRPSAKYRKWENQDFRPPSFHSWSSFISDFFTFTVSFTTEGQSPFFLYDFISLF